MKRYQTTILNLKASYLLKSDGLLNEKVSAKIEEMGSELFLKTKIGAYVYVTKNIGKTNKNFTFFHNNHGKSITIYPNNINGRILTKKLLAE